MASIVGDDLVKALLGAEQKTERDIEEQRARVAVLKQKIADLKTAQALDLAACADILVKKSVWGIGGDGWATTSATAVWIT